MISIQIIKICGEYICKPLGTIFGHAWKIGSFAHNGKNKKQEVNNYRPISLLLVSSKIFERLLYDSIFTFFTENSLIFQNQSGFKPGDSCTNQLLSITYQIYKSFDDGHEFRSVFLDISKALGKLRHKCLIFKLKENDISGKFLSTLTDFLNFRKQRVVLNGQLCSWANTESGVPQGSILGLLLFLIFINGLSECLTTNVRLFADAFSLFFVVENIDLSTTNLNSDLSKINAWASQWKMTFNPDPNKKAQGVIFSRKIKKTSHPPLKCNNNSVKQVQFQKHLGVYLDDKLNFREYLHNIFKKVNKTIRLLRKLQNNIPRAPLVTIYKFFVRSHLDYVDILNDQRFNNSFHEKLEPVQYNAELAITGAKREAVAEENFIKDEALNLFSNDGGTGNFVSFSKPISKVPL